MHVDECFYPRLELLDTLHQAQQPQDVKHAERSRVEVDERAEHVDLEGHKIQTLRGAHKLAAMMTCSALRSAKCGIMKADK